MDEADEAIRIGKTVVAERDERSLGAGLDLLHIGLAAKRFDRDDLQEVLDLRRQRPEPVHQFGAERFDLALILQFGEPTIKSKTHRQIGDVIFRNHHGCPHGDLRRPPICGRCRDASLQTRDRLFQHLLVEFESDLLDMPGLLLPQKIAGAADVEVMGGKLKAGAQGVE